MKGETKIMFRSWKDTKISMDESERNNVNHDVEILMGQENISRIKVDRKGKWWRERNG